MNKIIIVYSKSGKDFNIIKVYNTKSIVDFNDILYKNISVDKMLSNSNDGNYMLSGNLENVDNNKNLLEILINVEVFNLEKTIESLDKEFETQIVI